MNASNRQVYVAMSGGVDSAVSAAQLLSAGYRVTGIHMTAWVDSRPQDENQRQPAPQDLAQQVSDALAIPLVVLDVQEKFYTTVVQSFMESYLAGQTPNPCLFCNPQVKWGMLQSYALEQGADYFATGHYARVVHDPDGTARLLRGADRTKDQSYVLSMLSQAQLQHTLLPLGAMTKAEVRAKAERLNLAVSDQPESQDLCFIREGDYRDFLEQYAPDSFEPGEIVDQAGQVLGEHQGLPWYTIGQRKGIRIAASEPYYVVDKDLEKNRLIVGFSDQMGRRYLTASQPNWISGEPPQTNAWYQVMIRYRSRPEPAELVSVDAEGFRLEFKSEIRHITPGQVAVLYQDDQVLGGGVIRSSG